MGKEGNCHLKSITCSVYLISPTSSPSWDGTSLIYHPMAPFQSPNVTKNANKITRSRFAGLFIGKEGHFYLKSIICTVFLICPTWSLSWGGTPPIHHHRAPIKAQK